MASRITCFKLLISALLCADAFQLPTSPKLSPSFSTSLYATGEPVTDRRGALQFSGLALASLLLGGDPARAADPKTFTEPPIDPGSFLQSLLQLENKTALVTGSTSGLGRAVAEALVRAGVKVAINGRDKERTEKACAEIAQACVPLSLQAGAPRVVVAYGDTSSDDEAQQVVDQTVNAFGGSIDILINNAGINLPEDTFEAQTLEQWDQISAVNIGGPIRITKAALPHLKKSHAGRIINFASILGHVGGPSNTMYTMTKAAMLLFSKSLAAELANTSITVNSISPGVMATRMNSKFEADKKTKGNVEKLIPMGRFGTPDEVVGAVLFFSSDASSYCTGSDILVDGGFTSV